MLDGTRWEPKPDGPPPEGLDWDAWLGPAPEVPEFQCITYDDGDFAMTCESGNAKGYMRKFPGEVRYGDTWPHWPTSATRVEIYGTQAMMLLGRHGCGWQVVVEGGKIIAQDKGYFPDKWHQPNFIDCIRSRRQPNADIESSHHSACLVHLANALLKPAYRKHYRIPDVV